MKVSARINHLDIDGAHFRFDSKNKLLITFDDGAGRQHARNFFYGSEWKRPDGRTVSVPERNLFQQYLDDRGDEAVSLLQKSLRYRFKGYNVKEQLERAGNDIIDSIIQFVFDRKVRPGNGEYWHNFKGGKPTGYYTGEMLHSLVSIYSRDEE